MAVYLNVFLPDGDASASTILVGEGISSAEGKCVSPYRLINSSDITKIFKPRARFTHKGTYGHALIIAGIQNTMGAALLCCSGCMHAGAGLTTACIPDSGLSALNTSLPEVMFLSRSDFAVQQEFEQYQSIAVGPGLGTSDDSVRLLRHLLGLKRRLVIDADGLSMLSGSEDLMAMVVEGSILTPHVKEFDRLFGNHSSWKQRLDTGRDQAARLNIIIVLKNEYTFIITPQGDVLINPTGNPAMAQGGMGDVLTGLISAYSANGYSPVEAALLGCYVHGLAGDELAKSQHNVTASKLALQVPYSVKDLLIV